MDRAVTREPCQGGTAADTAVPRSFERGIWSLPWTPAACGLARTAVRNVLPRWGLDDLVPAAELLVSELVCNALRHGAGPLGLTLERVPDVRCSVSDGSSKPPRPTDAGPEDEGGRGLALVDMLAARWGCERGLPAGKTVWFELSTEADTPGPDETEAPDRQNAPWRDGCVPDGLVTPDGDWKDEAA
ncbi:ATP-binding protein [Streptomyces cellostaticus]|uniref:ATP-binding protein n=1 Tax=Streptomyces cellostaticus TaxID=67285 RepID=UPI003133C9D2